MSIQAGELRHLFWEANATDLAAGTTQEIVAPFDGYIEEAACIVQTAIVTGGDVTFATGDALGTTVNGLTLTVADAAAKGARVTDTPTAGHASRAVTKGMRIGVLLAAAFNGGGALRGYIAVRSADLAPALP
jgi:hypothetical protein